MSAVDPLRIKVKRKTETDKDPMMMNGRLLFPDSATAPPRITGNNGKMHGAKTVKIPAINETINKVMLL